MDTFIYILNILQKVLYPTRNFILCWVIRYNIDVVFIMKTFPV